MDYKIVIPARFGSSRLPGKPLLDIAGKPMIQHVFNRAVEAGFDPEHGIVIATDDQRIMEVALSFGGLAMMTSVNHNSGTDRLAEVATVLDWTPDTIVVNLQGDEPLMTPSLIRLVADNLAASGSAGISTLATPIVTPETVFDPNTVKVVTDCEQNALYFSRAPIPWVRGFYPDSFGALSDDESFGAFRHLGIYAYRVSTLQALTATSAPAIENFESLEQLRALWLGIKIHVGLVTEAPTHGVDTQADLEQVRAAFC